MPERGLFIVFEGLDRCGKSTQAAKLEETLKGKGMQVRSQKFPDRTTPIGIMIDSYLRSATEMDDRAIHLLFSANRWECAAAIERDLNAGITIIADRYAFSGIAFSAAKGLPFNWLLTPDKSLPSPDLTLYLTLPPSQASSRADYGQERYESLSMQSKVREQFKLVSERVKRDERGNGRWVEVDAGGTREEVGGRIWGVLEEALEGERGEVGRLWTDGVEGRVGRMAMHWNMRSSPVVAQA